MKKFFTALMAVLCLVGFSCYSVAEENDLISKIQNAGRINWASRDYIILDNQMIRVSDGKVLFDTVYDGNDGDFYYNIASTGNYVWFHTSDGIYIMDQTGNIQSYESIPDGWLLHSVSGKYGLFYGIAEKIVIDDGNQPIIAGWTEKWEDGGKTIYRYSDSERGFVYDPETNQLTILSGLQCINYAYENSSGQVYFLSIDWTQGTFGICKANGEQIVEEGKYGYALNHNGDPITNEYLTVYTDNGIGAISPFTGEVIWTLDGGYWPLYDAAGLIYSDNTSIVENEDGRMIVGLDGAILSRISCNDIPYRNSVYGGFGENYNVLTDRTYYTEKESDGIQYITCEETGEIFKEIEDENKEEKKFESLKSGKILSEDEILESGEIIPERYEKYKPVEDREYCVRYVYPEGEESYRIEITSPDGTVLGGQYWKGIPEEWCKWRGDIADCAIF